MSQVDPGSQLRRATSGAIFVSTKEVAHGTRQEWRSDQPGGAHDGGEEEAASVHGCREEAGGLDVLGYIDGRRVIELATDLEVTRGAINRWLHPPAPRRAFPPQGLPRHRQRALPQPRRGRLAANRHRIKLFRLPPYSPELNSIEGVWKTTKKTTTHNRFFRTTTERDAALTATFEHFNANPLPSPAARFLCSPVYATLF